jgi:hypothetical protein
MLRKLGLSVVGAFFTSKSTMGVSLALLVSLAFAGMNAHYFPYKSLACNRLQLLCLTVLSLGESALQCFFGLHYLYLYCALESYLPKFTSRACYSRLKALARMTRRTWGS